MIFFDENGAIRKESTEESFGWIWKDLNEGKYPKMIIYNANGDIELEREYHGFGWEEFHEDSDEESITKSGDEDTLDHRRDYRRMCSITKAIREKNFISFLTNLNNKESHLILSIISSASMNLLKENKLRQPSPKQRDIKPNGPNFEFPRMQRLKRLHELFDIEFSAEIIHKQNCIYNNRCLGHYFNKVHGVRNVLMCDCYQSMWRNIQIDLEKNKFTEMYKMEKPNEDIDKTLFKLFGKTCEMHFEVGKIRKCFLDYDDKIEICLKECQNIQEDIYETKFLDDIISTLDYKIEDVSQNWPFRLVNSNVNIRNQNFII